MFPIHLSVTEIRAIERAFDVAFETGRMPDPAVYGDEVCISVLRKQLRQKLADYEADTWGGRMKLHRKQHE